MIRIGDHRDKLCEREHKHCLCTLVINLGYVEL